MLYQDNNQPLLDKNVVIEASNVSKKFCKNLKYTLRYGFVDISKNVIGLDSKSYNIRPYEFWALDDISFKLMRGEVLGIIGPNGSGKSTLLKLLNGIMLPDKGKLIVRGRLGVLIEVGVGFHPMLTGRENIYINGSILGMSKNEIDDKFEQIVQFAEIKEFLDTPVKNYSSGMYVRLGFSIAIHSNPDILVVDEILSVSDISFQTNAFKKMLELVKDNKSIIFISHNLNTISNFTKRAIYLKNGKIVALGSTDKVVHKYLSNEKKLR